jgi:thiol:disulfide interchange protein
MKKLLLVCSLAFVGMSFLTEKQLSSQSTEEGIQFQSLSLEDAKKQSLKSGKLIFIDAYASWCGPCKRMAATSFKNREVGKVYNEQFINLKIDCEKDADGPELARMYKVKAYPTLLVIDGNGKLIKEVVGMQMEDGLLALANSLKKKK